MVRRHVLYLVEINSSQAETWPNAAELVDAEAGGSQTPALFPKDRCETAADDSSLVRLRLRGRKLFSLAGSSRRRSLNWDRTSLS